MSLVRGWQFLPPRGVAYRCVHLMYALETSVYVVVVDSSVGYTTSQSSVLPRDSSHPIGQVWWVKHPVYARGRHGISDKPHTLFP